VTSEELCEDALGLVNNGAFRVIDPGPLHAPVRSFAIRRDEKLRLIIDTEASPDAASKAVNHPSGRIMLATERAKLLSPGGTEALIEGLMGSSVTISHGNGKDGLLRESVKVHRLTVSPGDVGSTAYTIDWLENLPRGPFIWPDSYKMQRQTSVTRTFGRSEDQIIRSDGVENLSFANSAARITVDGMTVYVCALDERLAAGTIHPGCILYAGRPDDEFRRKVRVALSFVLGVYLVDLGTTFYDYAWQVLLAIARDAYSIGMRAFDLHAAPLAPVGAETRFQFELTEEGLDRAVNAFVAAYDDLDLGNLSWAYWHACTATTHIAPVHFGAAIEALQRRYVKKHGRIVDAVIPLGRWKLLHDRLASVVAESVGTDEEGQTLSAKLKWLNRLDQRPMLTAVLSELALPLSSEEDAAWSRRNKAAHGMPIPEGQSLSAIRDTRLLRGIFHRMLLRMTGAASSYVDYASEGFPHKSLGVPPVEQTGARTV
jgi:hypothetical protein